MEKYQKIAGRIEVWLMLVLFPVFLTDKLNNVTKTRYIFFLIAAFSFFAFYLGTTVVSFMKKEKHIADWKLQKADVAALLFLGAAVLSFLVSPYRRVALGGAGARYIGLYFMLACVCLYITVSRCYVFAVNDMVAVCGIAILIHVLGFLQYLGFDPFGFFAHVPQAYVYVYLSTLGNVDIYGMYTVTILSISAFTYMMTSDKKRSYVYLATAISSMVGVMICDSDMAVLGTVTFFIVALPFVFAKEMCLLKYLYLCTALFLCARFAGVCYLLKPGSVRLVEGLAQWFVYENASMLVFVLVFLALLLSIRFRHFYAAWIQHADVAKIRKIYVFLWMGILGLVVLFVFVATAQLSGNTFFPESIFRIDDTWGSNRGYIWKHVCASYLGMPLHLKLFGSGEGTIAQALSYYSDIRWNLLNGGVIENAHNIWLQFLVTEGIVGLVAYVALLVVAVKKTLHRVQKAEKIQAWSENDILLVGIGIAVVIYALQGSCMLLEVITFPIFMCLLAVINTKETDL